jgi:AraC-like DNA-binding protein
VKPVLDGLASLGHDPAPLLRAAGIDGAELADPEARVPHAAMMAFWDAAAERTGDAAIALHVAEAVPPSSFDVSGYAFLASACLRDALERSCRWQRLIHDATTLTLEEREDGATLRHALPGGRPVPRHPAEFLAGTWVRLARLVVGEAWAPREVRFAHAAPPDVREHARFFRAPVRFGAGENAVDLERAALDAPSPRSDPALSALLERYGATLLARAPRSPAIADRARAALALALDDGHPGAPAVARRLHMSVRSLSRALAAEGTSVRELLDALRRERALRLLRDPRNGIAEVAFLCGFSELSAFHRAFRRWTGKTPGDVRPRPARTGSPAPSRRPGPSRAR